MTRKVCVLVTARPSYARIKSALLAITRRPELELQLVVAGSALLERYGQAVDFIERDGFKVAARVYMVLEGENLVTSAKSTGLALAELATVFDNLRPDVVVSVADRYETLATAAAAAYMNIPVAHVQGGEVTGSIDEKVRHAVTKLSNLHFVSTKLSAERVIRLGEPAESVFVTGCPSIDLAYGVQRSPAERLDPIEKYGGVGAASTFVDDYLVVMQHPVTTEYEQARSQIVETLHAVRDVGMPTMWFWPNVDAGSDGTSNGIRTFREQTALPRIHFFKNMAPDDFLRVVNGARCIVGNSSVAIRECSFLGVPAVNIGTRQLGRERAENVVDVGHVRSDIRNAIADQAARGRFAPNQLYGDGFAGERVANVLATVGLSVEKRLTF